MASRDMRGVAPLEVDWLIGISAAVEDDGIHAIQAALCLG